jgi:hypothetical protein
MELRTKEQVFRRATGQEDGRLIDWRCRSLGTPRVATTRAVYRFDVALEGWEGGAWQ